MSELSLDHFRLKGAGDEEVKKAEGGNLRVNKSVVLLPEVKDTCPFFPSKTVFSFFCLFLHTESHGLRSAS